MNRLLPILLLFSIQGSFAQSIYWTSNCSEKTFCFDPGDCSQGEVFMAEQAETLCGSPTINYTHKIDLFNDGPYEIQSSLDTVTGFLPAGTHRILWRATDNCGQFVQCTYLFHIEDCNPPNLVCINGLTQTMDPPFCEVTFEVDQFILNLSDNCTPPDQIERAMRRAGTGQGFPTEQSLTYGICDNGLNLLEVWVRDTNGHVNSCNNYVIVQSSDPACDCNVSADLGFSGCARSANDMLLSNYRAMATVQSSGSFSKVKAMNTIDSCFSLQVDEVPLDSDYVAIIRADRPDAVLNGITTFDLVMISKHILGIEALTSAYQMEAADVNNSNSVTTFDIVETRKLLLGINDTFQHVPSWRFVRPLPDPSDLGAYTALQDTYMVSLTNLQVDTAFHGYEFVGIKYGDINYTAALNGAPDDRTNDTPLILYTEDRHLNAGEVVTIEIRLADAAVLDGWQLALSADPASLELLSVEGIPEADYLLTGNELRAVSYDGDGRKAAKNDAVFILRVKVLQPVRLSQALQLNTERMRPEAYIPGTDNKTLRHPIELRYDITDTENVNAFSVSPNPFSLLVDFNIKLERAAPALLEIFTLAGQRIYDENFELEKGQQAIRVGTGSWPNERVFVYRFWVGDELFSGKMVRI